MAIMVKGLSLYFLSRNNEIANTRVAIILRFFISPLRVDLPKKAIKIIVDAEEAIRPIEVERKPFKIFAIPSILLCFLKNLNKAIDRVIPVITHAKVATIAPIVPAILSPTKVEAFIDNGPGVI